MHGPERRWRDVTIIRDGVRLSTRTREQDAALWAEQEAIRYGPHPSEPRGEELPVGDVLDADGNDILDLERQRQVHKGARS